MSVEAEESRKISQNSPFAGCAIFIMVLLVVGFLIGFSVVVLFRQSNEIQKFTDAKPVPVEIVSLDEQESELNNLAEKLELFRQAVQDAESAALELTAEEMNLAIAAFESFKELRGTLRVREITPEAIHFEISFQLNGRPRLAQKGESGLVGSDPRYLNGVMVAKPGLLQREVVLLLQDIVVPGVKVPQQFIEQMSPYRIAERYLETEGIGPVMAGITAVKLEDGQVRFEKNAGEVAQDAVTKEEIDFASVRLGKFFAIAATLFLIFTAFVIFMGLRLKKRHA